MLRKERQIPPEGQALKAAREAKGLSYVELGAAVGYSDRQIRRIEYGQSRLSQRIRLALETVLGPLPLGQEASKETPGAAAND